MPLINNHTSPLRGIWKIEETDTELLCMLDNREWYAPRLETMPALQRRREWLAARVLLKTLLGKEVQVAYTETGRPYCPGEPYAVSISHTRGYAAVCVTTGFSPGIDIEYRSDRVKKVATRFLDETELRQISPECDMLSLQLYWSAKETVFKALGQPEVDFRRHIRIRPFRPAGAGVFLAEETRTCPGHIYRIRYEVTDAYVLTYISG
ncbi:MAG: 4'-phosphopantetheinyl transferase superfamily protein [Parabacteroides sp.]|nr:4'-phosphopantetheinyl transferase superfamily protein [Parabacteroides sp.]